MWFVQTNVGRIRLGCWMFNEEVDECLDLLLRKSMRSGISSVSLKNEFWIAIRFNDGVSMRAWNTNRWYSWLHRGMLGEYEWVNARPKANTMAELRGAIKRYYCD